MCISVGGVEAKGSNTKSLKVAWLARPGWSNSPTSRSAFFCEATPTFKAARAGHRGRGQQIRCTEPLAAFLPVSVELTMQSSTYNANLSLLHSQQQENLRVSKQYVDLLREPCVLKWPQLIRTTSQATADPLGGLPGSAAAKAHNQHWLSNEEDGKDGEQDVEIEKEDKEEDSGVREEEGESELSGSDTNSGNEEVVGRKRGRASISPTAAVSSSQ
eukprot:6195187-Pleurochrysis_carterae.AAC.1